MRPREGLALFSHLRRNSICCSDCTLAKAAGQGFRLQSHKGLRILCAVLPLNRENEATVGNETLASPHSVHFSPGRRKALQGLTSCDFVIDLRI